MQEMQVWSPGWNWASYSPCNRKEWYMTVQLTGEQKWRMCFKLLQKELALTSTCRLTGLSTLSCPSLFAHSISFTWNSLLLLLTSLISPTMQFSYSWHLKVKSEVKSLSHVQLFATPWTVAYQAHLPMGFSRQEYWSGLPFLSPRDLPDPEIKPRSPSL